MRQQRKFLAPSKEEDEEIDFLVNNPLAARAGEPIPFVLGSADLKGIALAVVAVKGWHTETFGTGVLQNSEHIFRFTEPAIFNQAIRQLGGEQVPLKILVAPSLPHKKSAREQAVALLREHGVDAILPFRTMLEELIDHVAVNRNYHKSDLLQTLRILKNYDLLKGPQLELFKPRRKRKSRAKAG